MRILSVSPYYEPDGGGLERYAHAVNLHLARRGHRMHALAFMQRPNGVASKREAMDAVHLTRLRPAGKLGNAPLHPGFTSVVAKSILEHRIDAVLAHTPVPFPAEAAYLAARRMGVPFVVAYHAGSLRGSSAWLNALARLDRMTLERRMLRGAAALVAVSPYVRDNALEHHGAKVTVVPPGVDLDRFHPAPRPPRRQFLFVGSLTDGYRWKGIDVLAEAMRRVPDAQLVLVGGGDRTAELQRRLAAQGTPARFAGRLPPDALVREYQQAAATVLPSTTDAESFGMVLAEANACGRPVVASRIGGIPAFVEDGSNGLLCEPGDPVGLAACLRRLLDDPMEALAMGRRGRKKVEKSHRWPDAAARIEGVLRQACGVAVRPIVP